ncbi:putative phosphorylase superfamily protein [Colletotrichum sp. SAR11_240]|nr:putative phosphorylase superfamily protein [Colletotrichum sp. SAR11_240]
MLFHDNCQSVALCGLGGIGKTQVALKLAYLTKEQRPEYSIFWVPASSKETFNEAYLAIARKLGVRDTDGNDLKIALREHLSSPDSGKWLLIIDNADDEGVLYEAEDGLDRIYDCLPQSNDGVTLFTTRFSRIATSVAGGNIVDLASMSFDEASDFMRQSLVKALYREGTVLKEILEDLTYLPLAIAQAAAYMNENKTSMQEYLDLLRNTKQDMIELLSSKFHDRTRYRNKDSQHPVATTWFLSFAKIHEGNPQAASLLMFVGRRLTKDTATGLCHNMDSHYFTTKTGESKRPSSSSSMLSRFTGRRLAKRIPTDWRHNTNLQEYIDQSGEPEMQSSYSSTLSRFVEGRLTKRIPSDLRHNSSSRRPIKQTGEPKVQSSYLRTLSRFTGGRSKKDIPADLRHNVDSQWHMQQKGESKRPLSYSNTLSR